MAAAKLEVSFRFYAELNDFLPPARRGSAFVVACPGAATVKHMIEALGVPHTEIELIVADGLPVGFGHRLRAAEYVSVFPRCAVLDLPPAMRVGAQRPDDASLFIADAHLGALARLLRMAGFDTLYRNDYADCEIVDIAGRQRRVVLTRDRDLLKHAAVESGCFVRAIVPEQQLAEVVSRFDLLPAMRPFSLCMGCNCALYEVADSEVRDRLPPSVRERGLRLTMCPQCRRVYWRGSHWQHMRALLDNVAESTRRAGRAP